MKYVTLGTPRRRPVALTELLEPRTLLSTAPIAANLPALTISATDATAAETLPAPFGTPDTGTIHIERTGGDTSAPLTVYFSTTGRASRGLSTLRPNDYLLKVGNTLVSTASVTIPANETGIDLTIVPTQDEKVEPAESVILNLRANAAYTLPTLTTRQATLTARQATVTISDLAYPIVSVQATKYTANEKTASTSAGTAVYKFTRLGGDLSQPVTINYTMSGTATNGTDYQTLSGQVNFDANATVAYVTLTPIDDIVVEGTENAALTITPDSTYAIAARKPAATTRILDWEVAPSSIANSYVDLAFSTGKSMRLILGNTGKTCFMVDSELWAGTLDSYTQTSSNTATLVVKDFADDSNGGIDTTSTDTTTAYLTFTSATSGTFRAETANGTKTGRFKATRITGSFAPASTSLSEATFSGTIAAAANSGSKGKSVSLSFSDPNSVSITKGTQPAQTTTYTYAPIGGSLGLIKIATSASDGGKDTWVLLAFTTSTKVSFFSLDLRDSSWDRGSGTLTLPIPG